MHFVPPSIAESLITLGLRGASITIPICYLDTYTEETVLRKKFQYLIK